MRADAAEGCKLYVGNLDPATERRDLDDEFSKFGQIADIWVARKPPGFAFVTFDDPRDAKDAVKEMDGQNVKALGGRIRVEVSRGGRRRDPPDGRSRRDRSDDRDRDYRRRSRSRGDRYRSRSRSYDRRRRSPSYGRGDRDRDRDRRDRD